MTRLLVLALLVVGCKHDDPGPPCAQVVDHMLGIMKQGLTGHDALQLGNRKTMIDHCERKNFSKEARLCLVGATDLAGIASCQKLVTPAAAGSAAPAAPPASPPPGGSAGSATSGTTQP
jgi:hypothetical protein